MSSRQNHGEERVAMSRITRTMFIAVAPVVLGALLLTSGTLDVPATRAQERTEISGGPLRYQVVATRARLNRKVMGPVVHAVHGVPAEPVNSFVYDGDGSTPITAQLILEVDPVAEIGFIQAQWVDENGSWRYVQRDFLHPEHPSGVRLGTTSTEINHILNEGVTENVYLHGDTTAGMPVLPTVFTHLATWGPVEIELDGEPFENPYEIPRPQWLGHIMVTEGVRHEDGTVRTLSGEIYDMSRLSDGAVEQGDLEVHLVFHDEKFPMTNNMPPLFSFFYHLVFEDVSIRIVESREPIVIDEPGQHPVKPGRPTESKRHR